MPQRIFSHIAEYYLIIIIIIISIIIIIIYLFIYLLSQSSTRVNTELVNRLQ